MTQNASKTENIDPFKPYKGRFEEHQALPAKGRDQDDILNDLSTMAEEENAKWQTGQVSGGSSPV